MPAWRALLNEWPHALLDASGAAVGLPPGQMGNSEVGHLNLGAGRPVVQDLPRIDAAIADGSFAVNPALHQAVARAGAGHRLHLVGLLGPGGVHSVDRHAVEIARLARLAGATDVVIHGLLDGRDTPPRSADAVRARFRGAPGRSPPEGAHRHDRRPLLRHGPRPALGARQARATTRSCTAAASTRRAPRQPSRTATPAARTTSSSSRRSSTASTARSATATW